MWGRDLGLLDLHGSLDGRTVTKKAIQRDGKERREPTGASTKLLWIPNKTYANRFVVIYTRSGGMWLGMWLTKGRRNFEGHGLPHQPRFPHDEVRRSKNDKIHFR